MEGSIGLDQVIMLMAGKSPADVIAFKTTSAASLMDSAPATVIRWI
jgi:aspartyl-tRNA synthetase